MKGKSHQSLIRFLQWTLRLALYAEVGMVVIILVTFLMTATSEEDALLSAWPITLSEQTTDVAVTTECATVHDLSLTLNQGLISFSSDTFGYYLLKLVDALFLLAVIIAITVLLRRIFSSLLTDGPFILPNAYRLRTVALLLILLVPYDIVKAGIYHYFLLQQTSVVSGKYVSLFSLSFNRPDINQVWLDLPVDFLPLLIGLMLLVVSEIFRAGVLLRLDNESIV